MQKENLGIEDFFEGEGIAPTTEELKKIFPTLLVSAGTCCCRDLNSKNTEWSIILNFEKKKEITAIVYNGSNGSRKKIFTDAASFLASKNMITSYVLFGEEKTPEIKNWDIYNVPIL